ncbi:DUF1127 domain-containing protein [Roseovarius ramblicola]|uniref:DUF1127 domain-containing protein n=1 Tax=Roseovarius ramblicola TaxID=2022336 RepID=A0ABV5I080_9RHOB
MRARFSTPTMKTSEAKAMNFLTVQGPPPWSRFAPNLSRSTGPTALARWLDRQRQRAHLSRLDAHLLDDIAVSRVDAAR